MIVKRKTKKEIMWKLRDKIKNNKSIAMGRCDTGLTAKFLEKAGFHAGTTKGGLIGFETKSTHWKIQQIGQRKQLRDDIPVNIRGKDINDPELATEIAKWLIEFMKKKYG